MREPIGRTYGLVECIKATYRNKCYLENIRKILDDPQKSERLAVPSCRLCFYNGRVGGAMCTSAQCATCETIMRFGSTSTDILCQPCAMIRKVCKQCGADLNDKERRKL